MQKPHQYEDSLKQHTSQGIYHLTRHLLLELENPLILNPEYLPRSLETRSAPPAARQAV